MAGVIDQFEADKHFFNGFEWGTCVQRIAKPDEELFTLGCCGPYPKDLLKLTHIYYSLLSIIPVVYKSLITVRT